jgi:hypothetical protein
MGNAMIKIDFEFDTPHGLFRDALHLPEDHAFSEADIQALKEERRDNWIAVVTAPPVEEPPSTVTLDGVVYEKIEVEGQIVLKPVQE